MLNTRAFSLIVLAVFLAAPVASDADTLIDVAFAGSASTGKTGFAATGMTTNDFWNTYVLDSGSMANLRFADDTLSGAGLTIANVSGAYIDGASDPMYGTYLYSINYSEITVTIDGLGGATYNIYLYGHGGTDTQNSVFQLAVGAENYGSEATTNGSGWLSSQWQEGVQYVEFTNVVLATGQTITVTVEPGGSYDAILSGIQLVTVGQPDPIAFIYDQPAYQEVLQGSSAAFNVAAGGTPPLGYQWLSNNTVISGATSSSYSVTDARPADAGNYSVIVSNAYNSVTSSVALLAVVMPPDTLIDVAFTGSAPTGKTGFAATGITTNDFWNTYVMNSGSMVNLKFADGTLSGAGLTVANVSGVYIDGASDPMYGTYLYSVSYSDITVTIDGLGGGTYNIYFYGHGNADNQNSIFQLSGGVDNYASEATTNGSGWLSSQWQEGVQYVEFTNVIVPTGQTITVTVEPGGSYDAILSGIQLATVGQPDPIVFIYGQPAYQEALQGSSVSFSVGAGGAPPLTYQWYFNNTVIPTATNSSYSVTNAQPTDAGDYSVIVSNAYNTVTSASAPLDVVVPPAILIDVAFTGSSATGKTGLAATGITTNDFWNTLDVNSGVLTNLAFVDGTTSGAFLTLSGPFIGVGGNGTPDPMYNTYLDRLNGNMVVTITNMIPGAYDFYFYGHGGTVVAGGWSPDSENGDFQLTVGSQNYGSEATTNGPGWLSPVWQEGVQYVEFTNVSVSTGQTITINITPGAFIYSVISGLQIASIDPTNQNPFIVAQPSDQSGFLNSNANFSVMAGGTAPLKYQWLFNGTPISGATDSSYGVPDAQSINSGNYSVLVTNAYGSVTSVVAALNVVIPVAAVVDIAFTDALATTKTGFAATGVTTNDFWNTSNFGLLSNLKFVDGTSSGAGLTAVAQIALGLGVNGSSDAMYGVYAFAYGNGDIIVTLTNLPPATYDFFLYGHGDTDNQNSIFQLDVSSAPLGTEATTNGPGWLSDAWQAGVQYVEFTNVTVVPGQTVTITVEPGVGGFAVLSGLQMAMVGPPSPIAAIITQPTNLVVAQGSNATFSVLAGGPAPFSYQWLFNNVKIPAATNESYMVTGAQRTNAGGYSVIVSNSFGSVTSLVAKLALFEQAGSLIDVDFTSVPVTTKTGFAATGVATNDFWNTYSGSDTEVGVLTNLVFADGTISDTGLIIGMVDYSNASTNGAFDPMFGTYLYPSFGGDIGVQVTNLSPGIYNVYLYGHGASNNQNSIFQLTVGSQNYGSEATTTNVLWRISAWQEGRQYVEFTNVEVFPRQTVAIEAEPAAGYYYAVMSGLQIKAAGPPLIVSTSNLTVDVGELITITNQAYSPYGPFSFTLGPNAPTDASISSNGVFRWSPSCVYGNTTNLITVWATDSSAPPQSNSMTFAVTVNGCVEISIGSSVQQTGFSTCVPINLFSTISLTNLSFTLSDVTGHLTNWNMTPTNSVIDFATVQMVDPLHALFNIGAQNGQTLLGSNSLGSICMDVLPGVSAFVLLIPSNIQGEPAVSSNVFIVQKGRVVVIGDQSLLEATMGANSSLVLTVYGNPGVTYHLLSTSDLNEPVFWSPIQSTTLTNLFQTITLDGMTNQRQFFRTVQP